MKLSEMRYYTFFLLFFNIVNISSSMLVLACCLLYLRDRKSKPEQSAVSRGVLAFFITLALFTIVTAVLGFVGIMKQHIRSIQVHACFYTFLISVEAIVGMGAIFIKLWVGDTDDLRLHFYQNTTLVGDTARQQAWDVLQDEMHCCGVDGPQDYAVIHREIPPSCCSTAYALRKGGAKRQLHSACVNEHTYYKRGCEGTVVSMKNRNERLTGLFVIIVIFLEMTIIMMSVHMVERMQKQRRHLQQNLQAHFES